MATTSMSAQQNNLDLSAIADCRIQDVIPDLFKKQEQDYDSSVLSGGGISIPLKIILVGEHSQSTSKWDGIAAALAFKRGYMKDIWATSLENPIPFKPFNPFEPFEPLEKGRLQRLIYAALPDILQSLVSNASQNTGRNHLQFCPWPLL